MQTNNKLREVLAEIRLLLVKVPLSIKSDIACGIINTKVKHALGEPMRNCDLYNLSEAKVEYKKYRTEICLRESNPFIANDETLPFDEWLFAKAKGDNNADE